MGKVAWMQKKRSEEEALCLFGLSSVEKCKKPMFLAVHAESITPLHSTTGLTAGKIIRTDGFPQRLFKRRNPDASDCDALLYEGCREKSQLRIIFST